VPRLIINADDFGLTSGVNRGILEAHQRGVVTSATLMANGRAFSDASTLAKSASGLSVGCHVVLVDGCPLLPAPEVATLVTTGDRNAHFRHGLAGFAAGVLAGKIDPDQIEAEAAAQIRKIQAAGVAVSHFDTHKHTHLFPAVLRPLLRAATKCGVRALRNPFPPHSVVPLPLLFSIPGLWKRYAQLKYLRRFAEQFRLAVQAAGQFTTEGTLGVAITGHLDTRLFQTIVERLPEGTWEFVCHPGYNDAELEATRTRLKASRERELEVLTSTEAKAALSRLGVEAISFRDLALTA
jgi:chitin disaccharide deacetylase